MKRHPIFASLLATSALGLSSNALAQSDEENAILVLDASGSMWGQIDGEAKIVSARRVVGDLLDDMPANKKLGLVAYGHNRKGDCDDIEEIVPLGGERTAIKSAINSLNPKGKTPLSASVKFAAELLKYQENKATVILVSDGIETCSLDPCAVGAKLENDGIDFTAHVIGFDIKAEQDRVGLQCLAENTGGKFVHAENADQLSAALEQTVTSAPDIERVTGLYLRATELAGGPVVEGGLTWKVQQAGGGEMTFETADAGETQSELAPGTYDVFVERPSDGLKGSATNIQVRAGSLKTVTVPLELQFDASVLAVPEAPVSSEIVVQWTGPARDGDYLTITRPDAPATAYNDYTYLRNGNPLTIRMPEEAGDYEVRYVLGRPARVLATAPIQAIQVEASLEAPATVGAGTSFDVTWTGPGYSDDWITVVKPGAGEIAYTDYKYTKQGNPLSLMAPLDPGNYELRYLQAGKKIIARQPIEVTGVTASVSGPTTAMAGTRHPISWTGPAEGGDWMTIVKPEAAETAYTDYAYMKTGNPLTLLMPLDPGEYELRYVQNGKKVIARQSVNVTAAEASLTAPESAKVGETIKVDWSGPAEGGDWITVVDPSAAETAYKDYVYPKTGNPLDLTMPLEPGSYELRYVLNGKKVVARNPIAVTDVEVSVSGPSSATVGQEISVEWTGPAFGADFITVVAPGAAATAYGDYVYPKFGNPSSVNVPSEPGEYEIRYVLGGKRVVARQTINVGP